MTAARSFVTGAAIGAITAATATIAVRNVASIGWKVDALSQRITQILTSKRRVHFSGPVDDILLDHGRPVVEGDDWFTNPTGQ